MKLIILISIFCFSLNPLLSQNKSYIETKKAREEIDSIIKIIEEVHYNPYFLVKKEQFLLNKQELINNFAKDSIPYISFISTGMKLVAQLSGGHTTMAWQNRNIMLEFKGARFIPFTGKLKNNNQQLVVTSSAIEELKKGDIIKSINGVDIIDLYKECMTYVGGIEAYKNSACEKLLPIYIYFTEKISSPYILKLRGINTEIKTVGLKLKELASFISKSLPKKNYTFKIIEDSIGLISYNSCKDLEAFKIFLDETFMDLKKRNISKLIVDIRENGGGNSDLNDVLLSYLTKTPYRQSSGRYWKVSKQSKSAYKNKNYEQFFGEEFMNKYYTSENQSIIESFDEELIIPENPKNYFKGATCFLIGPNTFSSANFLADAIKTYNLSTLIGLPTGENTNDFGEQLSFTIPYSQTMIYVSSTYDIGANGNRKLMQPVLPDINVEENIEEFAIDWIKKKSLRYN